MFSSSLIEHVTIYYVQVVFSERFEITNTNFAGLTRTNLEISLKRGSVLVFGTLGYEVIYMFYYCYYFI